MIKKRITSHKIKFIALSIILSERRTNERYITDQKQNITIHLSFKNEAQRKTSIVVRKDYMVMAVV